MFASRARIGPSAPLSRRRPPRHPQFRTFCDVRNFAVSLLAVVPRSAARFPVLSSPGTAAQRLRFNCTAGPATTPVRCHSELPASLALLALAVRSSRRFALGSLLRTSCFAAPAGSAAPRSVALQPLPLLSATLCSRFAVHRLRRLSGSPIRGRSAIDEAFIDFVDSLFKLII